MNQAPKTSNNTLLTEEKFHDTVQKELQGRVFQTVSEAGEALNVPVYVIGGYVRDLLLGKECKDIDFVVVGKGIELAQKVAKKLSCGNITVYKNFGTAMLRFRDFELEFVGARKESYREGSRKPLVEDGTLTDDQNRRDLTINALAISLCPEDRGTLIDPFGGCEDLKKGIIRTPLDPFSTFSDDPLRMMRAIRFATQLRFRLSEETLKGIRENGERIDIVSMERITEELNKIIMTGKPSKGFKLLEKTGLLKRIFPELAKMKGVEVREGKGHKDNFYHTLEVLDNVAAFSGGLWLRWAALFHDIAKPQTKRFDPVVGWTFHGHEDKGARMVPKIFKRLKLPLDRKMKYVKKLVALHLRPMAIASEQATDSAARRLLYEAGDDVEDLLLLCKADITSKNPKKVDQYLKNYEWVKERIEEVEEKDRIRNWQPPVSGEEIMETFDMEPGPKVGEIKSAIKEAILDGEIPNDRNEALKFMVEKGRELGLEPVKNVQE